jgi:hypothetical protein
MSLKQKIVYVGMAVVAAFGIFLFGLSLGSGPQIYNESVSQFSTAKPVTLPAVVVIDNGDKITGYEKLALPQPANALELLKVVTTQNNLKLDFDASSSMGAFVKQIGDKINGQNNKYWQYWVNGVQPMVAADKFELKGGETILWTFRASQF